MARSPLHSSIAIAESRYCFRWRHRSGSGCCYRFRPIYHWTLRIGYKYRKRHVEIAMAFTGNLAVEYSFKVSDVLQLAVRLGDTWLDGPLIALRSARVRRINDTRAG